MRKTTYASAVALATKNLSVGDGRERHRAAGGEGNKGRASGLLLSLLFALTASFAHEARTASEASPVRLTQTDTAAKVDFNIPEQPLEDALAEWSKQSGLQVLRRDTDNAVELTTPSVTGKLSPAEALEKMLAKSGLRYEFINDRTVRIAPILATATTAVGLGKTSLRLAQNTGNTGNTPSTERGEGRGEVDKGSNDPQENSPESSDKNASESSIQEIVVTAQKRRERLQDVPVPVSAINGEMLANNNQLRLQDYYSKIPGLGLALMGDGSSPTVTIRGITTGGFTNPTVGVVVDEVPYGPTVTPGTAPFPPDIDPGDLARVEVLRGPQGTLYGASSIGGLLKFVTVDPSTDRVSGRAQIGMSDVRYADEPGYSFRGMINLPLSETFAVRASGFKTREPGYVDNIQTAQRDVNQRDSDGGRLSALWRPSENFSVKLAALVQDSERRGAQDVDVALGNEPQHGMLRGTGLYGINTQAYSATMAGLLGRVDLTSATGYSIDTIDTKIDQSAAFGFFANANFGVGGVAGPVQRRTEKFSQEFRASVPIGERVTGLFGAFYTDEDVQTDVIYLAAASTTGATAGTLLTSNQPSTFREMAAFANLTLEVTDRFDVQLGGRYSENEQTFSAFRAGPLASLFFGTDPSFLNELDSDDSVFTYLVTPRFKVSPDLMVYARFASGYRPGGPNAGCGIFGIPCTFGPDKTQNYELGMKGSLLDHVLSFDASVYYIDWKDIQLNLSVPGFGYQDNGSRAKSQGVELSVESRPLRGLTLAVWGAYNDAELSEPFPSTSTARGLPGDRLPYSGKLSGSFSADQEFPLGSTAIGFVGGSVSYVDERRGVFRRPTQVRATFPDYTQVDLHVGVRLDSWTINAYANNVIDERGVLRSGLDALRPTFVSYIEPRTLGLSLSKTF